MKYWLIKSEPSTWSWLDQRKVKKEMWDGVRNYQARNNLMKMKKGDLCFFYHSVNEKKIVGIVKVIKEHYPDPTDKTGKFVVVDVAAKKNFNNPVSLTQIKLNKKLHHLALIKQSRLSVMPIDLKSWKIINKLSLTKSE
jgi:predicted RNA-binding protein with PUA-like domain